MKKIVEFLFVTILFLAICLVYKGQPRISHNEGQGWDGKFYYTMSQEIYQGDNVVTGELPFVKRVGTPYLVAQCSKLTGLSLLDSALAVNLMGIYLTVILLVFWLGIYIDRFWVRGLLVFLFMMAWYVPLRMSFYEPMTSDAWGAALFMVGLYLLTVLRKNFYHKRITILIFQVLLFSIVVSVGNLFRESIAVLCIALFFIQNPLKELKGLSIKTDISFQLKGCISNIWKLYNTPRTLILLLPILFVILINTIVSNHIVPDESNYSYIEALFFWFYKKSLPSFLLGILHAVGPIILLSPFFWKEMKSVFWERQDLLVLMLFALFFGYFAGGDTERIFFMAAFPMLLVWIGFAIKNIYKSPQRWWLYVLLALQTIAFRFYWILPDFPNDDWSTPFPFFTLLGNHFQYLFLYSYHGQYILNSLLLAEYILLFLMTWFVIKKNRKNPFTLHREKS
jgi:hypothetical protein